MSTYDKVTVTTLVSVDPETAFRVFTEEVDEWWRREPRHRFRTGSAGVMRFEPGVGGRLLEVYDEKPCNHFEVGRVLAWEPGRRLVLEWRGREFKPEERTEVEVRFEADPQGTRVTLLHRGWDGLVAGHPARHGLSGDAFTSLIGLWWADLLVALRTRTAA